MIQESLSISDPVGTMILEKLRDAFDNEADILKEALSLEKEKTPAILQARGKRLKDLTERSDALLTDLARLEEERHNLFQNFIEANHDPIPETSYGIESFMEALESFRDHRPVGRTTSHSEWADFLDGLITSISHFRDTAISLKKEVQANQALLERTRKVIQGVMSDLERPPRTYGPEQRPTGARSPSAGRGPISLVLNANA